MVGKLELGFARQDEAKPEGALGNLIGFPVMKPQAEHIEDPSRKRWGRERRGRGGVHGTGDFDIETHSHDGQGFFRSFPIRSSAHGPGPAQLARPHIARELSWIHQLVIEYRSHRELCNEIFTIHDSSSIPK